MFIRNNILYRKLSYFVVFILVIIIMPITMVMAMDVCKLDEQGSPQCPSGSSIKLQIGIPGVSKDCSYPVKVYDFEAKELKPEQRVLHCVSDFPTYIAGMYKFFISIVGILAVIMIMLGGFQWLLAAGNAQKISGAKTTIISAIMGLVLTLGTYSILNWVNPSLVSLKFKPVGVDLKKGEETEVYCTKAMQPMFLEEGKIPECGVVYRQTEPGADGKDQFCIGTECGNHNACISGVCAGYLKIEDQIHGYGTRLWMGMERFALASTVVGKYECGDLYVEKGMGDDNKDIIDEEANNQFYFMTNCPEGRSCVIDPEDEAIFFENWSSLGSKTSEQRVGKISGGNHCVRWGGGGAGGSY